MVMMTCVKDRYYKKKEGGREVATERFYRLPQEKQDLIRNAAIKEFARVPFDQVSINQIVHNAEISRGSFYTYFEDKWDLFKYIFEDSKNKLIEVLKKSLKDYPGSIWKMYEGLFEYCVEGYAQSDWMEIFKNLNKGGGSNEFMRMLHEESNHGHNYYQQMQEHYDEFDISNLKDKSMQYFLVLHESIMALTMISLKPFFEGEVSVEDARTRFRIRLDIIQQGACIS